MTAPSSECLRARELCGRLRRPGGVTLFFEGDDREGWGARLADAPRPAFCWRRQSADPAPLERLDALVARRRRRGGERATGVAVLAGFDLFRRDHPADPRGIPDLAVFEVDAAYCYDDGTVGIRGRSAAAVDGARRRLEEARESTEEAQQIETSTGRPRTSLPRQDYCAAVEEIRRSIRRGDIYQANLIQRFEIDEPGDPFAVYRRLAEVTRPGRGAFVEWGNTAVLSASPELFLRADRDGSIETRPIKGTRPRGADPGADAALAAELVASAKDQAELLMIVDLERNDLGRICRVGSVQVPCLAELRTYPGLHHLVARVTGRLREGVSPGEILRATFPGGSISGAPKIRALEILRSLEPVERNFSMGSLLWFADDGSLDSSILIRTVVVHDGRAYLGAGGGVVADSDPVREWEESNLKARPLAGALGFEPEEAV